MCLAVEIDTAIFSRLARRECFGELLNLPALGFRTPIQANSCR